MPADLGSFFKQQFKWCTGMTLVLTREYPKLFARLPGIGMRSAERIAFQADLFDTHEPPRAAQLPAMRSLATQISRMKLDVDTLAPVHGKPVPWTTFEAALNALTGPTAQ